MSEESDWVRTAFEESELVSGRLTDRRFDSLGNPGQYRDVYVQSLWEGFAFGMSKSVPMARNVAVNPPMSSDQAVRILNSVQHDGQTWRLEARGSNARWLSRFELFAIAGAYRDRENASRSPEEDGKTT